MDHLRTQRMAYLGHQMRKSLPAGFCSAPFTQAFIYPTGDVFVCCEGAGHLGNLKENSLEELWNGPVARQLRSEFLAGKPIQCQKNIANKQCNQCYDDQLPDVELSEVQSKPPQALDLIVKGTCNLDCIMCDVKNEHENVLNLPAYQDEIRPSVLPQVKKISVKSGEPFVQKATFDLIEQVSAVNPDCVWQFTTNGQYEFTDRIRRALEKIRVERITFSVDSVDSSLFGEIRRKGTLERCERTMDEMVLWSRGKKQDFPIELAVNVTLQKKNWHDVPRVLRHFAAKKIPSSILYVQKPDECSLSTLSRDEAIEVATHYLGLSAEYEPHLPALDQALAPLFQAFQDPLLRKLAAMLRMRAHEAIQRKNQKCPLPFSQIALYPDGTLKPCCWLNQYDLRERPGDSIQRAWQGRPLARLREEHLAGNSPTCGDKMARIGCHRAHASLFSLFPNGMTPPEQIMRLDWFFSGKCNLQCPSCNNWQQPDEFAGAEETWESLKKDVLPYLCEIDLKGGEPFYQRRTFVLMETMRELNPHCIWNITTNGQISFGSRIRELLDGLMIGYFSVSIDSLDPARFAELRVGGELHKSLAFLDALIAFNQSRRPGRKFEINLNFVFQKKNWRETEAILQFAQSKGIEPYLIPMVEPRELSVEELPAAEFEEMRRYVDGLASRYSFYYLHELQQSLKFRKAKKIETSNTYAPDNSRIDVERHNL